MKLEPTRQQLDDMTQVFGDAWGLADKLLGNCFPGARRVAGLKAVIDYLNTSGMLRPVIGVDVATGATAYRRYASDHLAAHMPSWDGSWKHAGEAAGIPDHAPESGTGTYEVGPKWGLNVPKNDAARVGVVYGPKDTIPGNVTRLAAYGVHVEYVRVPAQPGWHKQEPGWKCVKGAQAGSIYSTSGLKHGHGNLRVIAVDEPERPVWMFPEQIPAACNRVARVDGTDGPDGTVFVRADGDPVFVWSFEANPDQMLTASTMFTQSPYGVRPVVWPLAPAAPEPGE